MSEYATGGVVDSNSIAVLGLRTCDYVLPTALADKLREALDSINKDVLD